MAQAHADIKSRMPWMPVVANETWLARTKADAALTRTERKCSGRGVLSVQLPFEFYPKPADCTPTDRRYNLEECANQRVPRCRCFPGFAGTNCEQTMSSQPNLHKCFNDCSGRGTCVHNWCHCKPGSWGVDCSLGGETPLPRPTVEASGLRPRIYVYDVPPRFTSWLGAFRRGDWTRDHWYGVDVMLHQQLLRSPYRTLDPEAADFFFIPLHLSLGYYSHRYYFKHFTQPAVKPLRDVLRYVGTTWPYLKRKGGSDHLIVMTQDQGNRYVRATVPESDPLIMIHHWGAPAKVVVDSPHPHPNPHLSPSPSPSPLYPRPHISPFTLTLTLTLTRRAVMVAMDMELVAAAGRLRLRWLPSHTPSQPLDAQPLTYQLA